jgi:hypothetical protein
MSIMTLRDTLRGLIRQAESKPGEPFRVRLAHKLTVAVKSEGDDVIALQLSRADVYPSTIEWRTVVQQWPGQCTVIKLPRTLIANSMYYLQGKIKMAPALIKEHR